MGKEIRRENKKLIFLCCDSSEEREIQAFISRKRFRAERENPGSGDDIEAHIIYPADVSTGDYMTYGNHRTPTEEERELLEGLTSQDDIYVWGHGSPNYAYIPGASYTEIADFLLAGIKKENFSGENPLKIHCEMCNSGRGGPDGESSFAGRMHAYIEKKGVVSRVTGRLRNVVIDFDNIRERGVMTLRREYDALLHMGLKLPDSVYKHQETGSKVTYFREIHEGIMVQVRQDSYRNALNREFLKFEDKLIERLGQDVFISKDRLKPELHQALLGVGLRLSSVDEHLDVKELTQSINDLSQLLKSNYNLTDNDLKELGFDSFRDKLMHQAQGGGLVKKTTGVNLDDPLLPNEVAPLHDVIKAHPLLKELSDSVKKLQELNRDKEIPNENLNKFIQSLGSEDDINDSSLYSSIYTEYRKSMLMENDGQTMMPKHLEKILVSTNKMVKAFAENPDMSSEEKLSTLNTYKKELNSYFTKSVLSNSIQTLSNYIHGFTYGIKAAWNERHGASLFETIGQALKSGYEWADVTHSNFLFYKNAMHQLHTDIEEIDSKEDREDDPNRESTSFH
ncbi:hypothetical protein [Legionella fallonii]|uniref:Uncharacterized protein n=1 Tax=Legionella fallonii LLAP-10 TaxID=1212491 RepID=A0A098G3P4_9GAMM|nr:hypothetical protein [Legionella fallonii]CEG56105.1 protein of unknown function [Peptidase_C80 domain] [Legionella fallonii LLAP-10]